MPMDAKHRYVKADLVNLEELLTHLIGYHWLALDATGLDAIDLGAIHQLDHTWSGAAHRKNTTHAIEAGVFKGHLADVALRIRDRPIRIEAGPGRIQRFWWEM